MTEFEMIDLEQFKLIFVQYVSDEHIKIDGTPVKFGEWPKVTIHTDIGEWGARECAVRIVQKIWGREVQRQEVQWPRDWWQAFKERWYPEWAKARWPVQYKHCVITARELYPEIGLPPDRYRAAIAVDKSSWTDDPGGRISEWD